MIKFRIIFSFYADSIIADFIDRFCETDCIELKASLEKHYVIFMKNYSGKMLRHVNIFLR